MASISSRNASASFPIQLSPSIVRMPTSATDLTTTDTVIFELTLCNTTNASINVTIRDKQGTPRSIVEATPVSANTSFVLTWNEGQFCSGGIRWFTSADGIDASLVAFKRY